MNLLHTITLLIIICLKQSSSILITSLLFINLSIYFSYFNFIFPVFQFLKSHWDRDLFYKLHPAKLAVSNSIT